MLVRSKPQIMTLTCWALDKIFRMVLEKQWDAHLQVFISALVFKMITDSRLVWKLILPSSVISSLSRLKSARLILTSLTDSLHPSLRLFSFLEASRTRFLRATLCQLASQLEQNSQLKLELMVLPKLPLISQLVRLWVPKIPKNSLTQAL